MRTVVAPAVAPRDQGDSTLTRTLAIVSGPVNELLPIIRTKLGFGTLLVMRMPPPL